MVFTLGYLDVRLLYHLQSFRVEEGFEGMELIPLSDSFAPPPCSGVYEMDILLKYFSEFTETQIAQFRALESLYKEWNAMINVVSRKDIDSVYEKHVLHSLSIAAAFNFPPGSSIIDIGTGGGFPGIPLAIFF